jgi:hypothetical protein
MANLVVKADHDGGLKPDKRRTAKRSARWTGWRWLWMGDPCDLLHNSDVLRLNKPAAQTPLRVTPLHEKPALGLFKDAQRFA